jgi:hypothetical protein
MLAATPRPFGTNPTAVANTGSSFWVALHLVAGSSTEALDTGGVWSIARGLARNVDEYKQHLAACDLLGDAELIIGMRAVGEAGEGHAEVPPENMGSIDKKRVAELAEEILEGGKDAFMTRHRKYGF